VEQAPADGPEDELADEQDGPDRQQDGEQEQAGERGAAEPGDAADLALDLVDLGLRELKVRPQQPDDGVAGRPELPADAGRGRGTRGVGCGPVLVQRSSSRMV